MEDFFIAFFAAYLRYLTMPELLQFFLRNAVLIFTFYFEQFSRELKCFRKVIEYVMNKMKQLFGLNPFLLVWRYESKYILISIFLKKLFTVLFSASKEFLKIMKNFAKHNRGYLFEEWYGMKNGTRWFFS